MSASAESRLWLLPLVVAAFPLGAGTVSAVIAMQLELVPACIPFVDGCTSISATGRYVPASYVFKGALLPYSVLLAVYWWLNARWLRHAGQPKAAGPVASLGISASACLIVYLVLLGSTGEAYEFMRRFGIYVFFLFTVIAQWRLASAYRSLDPSARRIGRWQRTLAIGMVLAGLANLVLKEIVADPDSLENVIEWNFAVIMFVNLALPAFVWRGSGFRLLTQLQR